MKNFIRVQHSKGEKELENEEWEIGSIVKRKD
jgi:hypothetical protein